MHATCEADDSRASARLNRRGFIQATSAATLAAAAGPLLPRTQASAAVNTTKPTVKPNLLFVMPDQWRRMSLGFMDQDPVQTPRLDDFARQSAVFTQGVAVNPICGPNRCCVYKGLHSQTSGHWTNDAQPNPEHVNIGQLLKAGGYRTGYVGKWHLGEESPALGQGSEPWTRPGFDLWYESHGHRHFFLEFFAGDELKKIDDGPGWMPIRETDVAMDFIKVGGDTPWACFLNWGPPHTGGGGLYNQRKMPGRKNKSNSYAAPQDWEALYTDPSALPERANVKPVNGDDPASAYAGYYGACSSLDHEFGRLMDALEATGQADNTIVVFTSDHGEMLGSHGRMTKGIWYEESIGVPMIVRWPAKITPRTDDTVFASLDWMASLLALCGVDHDATLDSRDRSDVLLGEARSDPDAAEVLYFNRGATKEKMRAWRAVRTPTELYVVAAPRRYRLYGPSGRAYFDLKADPYQTAPATEQQANATQRDRMNALHERLVAYHQQTGDPFLDEYLTY